MQRALLVLLLVSSVACQSNSQQTAATPGSGGSAGANAGNANAANASAAPAGTASANTPAAGRPFDRDVWRSDVEAWRAKHEADYRREWAVIAGLFFLKPGPNTVGSSKQNDIVLESLPSTIGQFVLADNGQVRFEPARGADVQLRGEKVTEPVSLRDDAQRENDELIAGHVQLVTHLSGDRRTLRVRDPKGELAREFAGFTWFPLDEQYRVAGRFIKDDQPRDMRVVNTMGDIDVYKTEGVVEFTLQGQRLRLRPFTTRPNRFYFVFRDASSGHETYETARFLYSDLNADGTTILDFNEAYNPPCSFNPYTTCPIPMKENILPVKILAGEQKYAGKSPH